MTPEERDELKQLVRQEPTIAATFAEVDAEFQSAKSHIDSIYKRRQELRGTLDAIEAAKQKLAGPGGPASVAEPAVESEPIETGEPASFSQPADKPSDEEDES